MESNDDDDGCMNKLELPDERLAGSVCIEPFDCNCCSEPSSSTLKSSLLESIESDNYSFDVCITADHLFDKYLDINNINKDTWRSLNFDK